MSDLLIFGTGGAVFLLCGMFSNFYNNQSIEILHILLGGIMGGDYFSVNKEVLSAEERENLKDRIIKFATVYCVGVVLMLVNANIQFYSLTLPTAPIGYFTCIGTYLGFIVYHLQAKYSFRFNTPRIAGFLILTGIGTISLVLAISGMLHFTLDLTNAWLLISAVLIGISVGLLMQTRTVNRDVVAHEC